MNHLPRLHASRKRLTIALTVSIVLLVVFLVTLFFMGQRAWQKQVEESKRTSSTFSSLSASVSSAKSPDERLGVVKKIAETSGVTCRGGWWYDWQRNSVPAAKDAYEACQATLKESSKLQIAARSLADYIDQEKELQVLLSSIKIDSSKENWQKIARKNAETASSEASKLTFKGSVSTTKEEVKKRIDAIVQAWVDVESASEKKDKAAYLTATSVLRDRYAELSSISDVSNQQLNSLIAAFVAI